MKKTILLGLGLSIMAVSATAEIRSASEARQIAIRHFSAKSQHPVLEQVRLDAVAEASAVRDFETGAEMGAPQLYVFNNIDKPGFVLVSGSTLTRPVLGYCDGTNLDAASMPENMRGWILSVEKALAWVEEHPSAALSPAQQQATGEVYAPLMGNIQWNQDAPYNDLCPVMSNGQRTVTGCVATAASQVIYYHRQPAQMQGGRESYRSSGTWSLSLDFDTISLDFDKMFDRWSSAYGPEQRYEVAKLNYAVGVGVKMGYGEMSGAHEYNLPAFFEKHLGYNPLCETQYRRTFVYDEWIALLNGELKANRPIIFTGSDEQQMGHCFVLDGLNADGLYHVNWGWGGYCDGYFDVCVLNSEGAGIGANETEEGFCNGQSAVVQVCPETTGRYLTPLISNGFSSSNKTVNLGGSVSVRLNATYNYGNRALSGSWGVFFENESGERVASQLLGTVYADVPSYYINGFNDKTGNVTIPSSLAEGKYRMYPCFSPSTGQFADSLGVIRSNCTKPGYVTVTVANGKATISTDSYETSVIASDWSTEAEDARYITYHDSKITCSVTNDGDLGFAGRYYLQLESPSHQKVLVQADKIVVVAPGETKAVSFTYVFKEAGTWNSTMYFMLQNINEELNYVPFSTQTFEVEGDMTAGASFQLTGNPVMMQQYCDLNADLTIALPLKNTGTRYDGKFQLQFYSKQSPTPTDKPVLVFTQDQTFEANATDSVKITGRVEGISAGKTYYVFAYYLRIDDFNKFETATGVTNRLKVNVYKEGTHGTDLEMLPVVDEKQSVVFDLMGVRHSATEPLPAGIYIINGKKTVVR